MVNTADIKRLIIKIASEEGVDPAVALAIAEQESRFSPNARNRTSKEDSIGLYQINKMAHPDYTGGANLEANIRYGLKYFKSQLVRAKGNVPLALAAYNGGWGGRNSKQAQNYAKQAFGRIGKYANVSNNANKITENYGDAINPILKGGITGMATKLNVPDPDRPDYQPYMTSKNTATFSNGEGLPPMRLTGDEIGSINAITAPVETPRDVRPDVVIGQDENGNPIKVTASQYNQLLNERDNQNILQLNQNLQQQLPEMAKAEIQLGGRNAYETLLGLRDEYNNATANDPRWDLVRLNPEQALDVMNTLKAKHGAGTLKADEAAYYQMMNSLQNYQTPYGNAYDLTTQGYKNHLKNMEQFQTTALTLAQGNQQLAQELMKQAVAGNKNVIDAFQKIEEARMKQEADHQKEIQSGYNTQLNTQREGFNTFYTGLPKLRQDQNQYINTYNLDRYKTDTGKYSTDVGTRKDLMMPQIQADVEARNPVTRAKLNIEQQRANAASQNANTAEAAAATNAILNSSFNSQGLNIGAETVPSLNTVLGSPTKKARDALFGGGILPAENKTIDFFSLFKND